MKKGGKRWKERKKERKNCLSFHLFSSKRRRWRKELSTCTLSSVVTSPACCVELRFLFHSSTGNYRSWETRKLLILVFGKKKEWGKKKEKLIIIINIYSNNTWITDTRRVLIGCRNFLRLFNPRLNDRKKGHGDYEILKEFESFLS